MRQASLLGFTVHGVVGSKKVAQQNALIFPTKNPPQDHRSTALVDFIIGQIFCCKTPEPVRFAIHPPTGFVGVQHGASQALLVNFHVPGAKYLANAVPRVNQAARREFQSQMIIEDVQNLRERGAKLIMQPSRKYASVQPDARLW